jgi:hypothetical protein
MGTKGKLLPRWAIGFAPEDTPKGTLTAFVVPWWGAMLTDDVFDGAAVPKQRALAVAASFAQGSAGMIVFFWVMMSVNEYWGN